MRDSRCFVPPVQPGCSGGPGHPPTPPHPSAGRRVRPGGASGGGVSGGESRRARRRGKAGSASRPERRTTGKFPGGSDGAAAEGTACWLPSLSPFFSFTTLALMRAEAGGFLEERGAICPPSLPMSIKDVESGKEKK